MNLILLSILAETPEGGSSDLAGQLGINAWAFLSQLVTFGIVVFVLAKWVFPIVQKTLEERKQRIQEGIENAERAKRDLAEANKRSEGIITQAQIEAQAIIERAQKNAELQAQRINEEAVMRAEQIGQQYVGRIQQEANRARNELSKLVVNLSIDAAGKVIGKSVDSKDNRRLVEEFVTTSDQARKN